MALAHAISNTSTRNAHFSTHKLTTYFHFMRSTFNSRGKIFLHRVSTSTRWRTFHFNALEGGSLEHTTSSRNLIGSFPARYITCISFSALYAIILFDHLSPLFDNGSLVGIFASFTRSIWQVPVTMLVDFHCSLPFEFKITWISIRHWTFNMHVHHAIWGNSTFGYNIARLQVVHNLINNNCQWTNLCTRNEIQKLKKCSPLLDDPTSFEPRPLCYEWATTLWKLSMPQVGSLCGHDHSQMPANERSKHFFGLWDDHKCISPFAICWDLNSFANLECSLSFSDLENNVHSFTLRYSTKACDIFHRSVPARLALGDWRAIVCGEFYCCFSSLKNEIFYHYSWIPCGLYDLQSKCLAPSKTSWCMASEMVLWTM